MRVDTADNDLMHLYPPFRKRLQLILDQVNLETKGKLPGVEGWKCAETFRSPQRQEWLYAQGRTRPGPIVTKVRAATGNHPKGLAADVYPYDRHGDIIWEPDQRCWQWLGHAVRTHKMQWGGDYPKITHGTFIDLPHVEPPLLVATLWTIPALFFLHKLKLR